jgi:hypothetical protein
MPQKMFNGSMMEEIKVYKAITISINKSQLIDILALNYKLKDIPESAHIFIRYGYGGEAQMNENHDLIISWEIVE